LRRWATSQNCCCCCCCYPYLRLTNRFAHTSQEISKLAFPCFWKEAFLQSRTDLPTCIWMISKKLISKNGFNEDHPKSFFLRLKKVDLGEKLQCEEEHKFQSQWIKLLIGEQFWVWQLDLTYFCFELNFVNYMFFAMYYTDTFKLLSVK